MEIFLWFLGRWEKIQLVTLITCFKYLSFTWKYSICSFNKDCTFPQFCPVKDFVALLFHDVLQFPVSSL